MHDGLWSVLNFSTLVLSSHFRAEYVTHPIILKIDLGGQSLCLLIRFSSSVQSCSGGHTLSGVDLLKSMWLVCGWLSFGLPFACLCIFSCDSWTNSIYHVSGCCCNHYALINCHCNSNQCCGASFSMSNFVNKSE